MALVVPVTTRWHLQAEQTGEAPVMLAIVTHPDLDAPVRLSSDPTVRLSTDPLVYGTRHQGEDYPFVLMSLALPDSQDRNPPATTLALANVTADMAAPLRAITSPATVELRVVLSSTPDQIEARYTGLKGTRGAYDAAQVSLDLSAEPWTSEPMPAGRMTADRFPGLHL